MASPAGVWRVVQLRLCCCLRQCDRDGIRLEIDGNGYRHNGIFNDHGWIEPREGSTGYPRNGFAKIYELEREYDAAQIRATLNGMPPAGPF